MSHYSVTLVTVQAQCYCFSHRVTAIIIKLIPNTVRHKVRGAQASSYQIKKTTSRLCDSWQLNKNLARGQVSGLLMGISPQARQSVNISHGWPLVIHRTLALLQTEGSWSNSLYPAGHRSAFPSHFDETAAKLSASINSPFDFTLCSDNTGRVCMAARFNVCLWVRIINMFERICLRCLSQDTYVSITLQQRA